MENKTIYTKIKDNIAGVKEIEMVRSEVSEIALLHKDYMNALLYRLQNSKVKSVALSHWALLADIENRLIELGYHIQYRYHTSTQTCERNVLGKSIDVSGVEKITFEPNHTRYTRFFSNKNKWESRFRFIYIPNHLMRRFTKCLTIGETYIATKSPKARHFEQRDLVGIIIGMDSRHIRIRAKSSFQSYNGAEDYVYIVGKDKDLDNILMKEGYIVNNNDQTKFVEKFSVTERTFMRRLSYLINLTKDKKLDFFNNRFLITPEVSLRYYKDFYNRIGKKWNGTN